MTNINDPIYEDAQGQRYQEKSAAGRALSGVGGFIKGAMRGSVYGGFGWLAAAVLTTGIVASFPMFLAMVAGGALAMGAHDAYKDYKHTGPHPRAAEPAPRKPPAPSTYLPYNRDIIRDRERERHGGPEYPEGRRHGGFAAREEARRSFRGERHH